METQKKKIDPLLFLVLAVAVINTVIAIATKQNFFLVLPLYISIIIMFMQAKVNRFAFILGSINSIYYGVLNLVIYKVFASAMQCFLVSCPIQLMTFIRWNKRPYGNSTVLRKMSNRARVLVALGCAIICIGTVFVLNTLGSSNTILDSIVTVLAILVSILMLLSYSEYAFLNVVTCALNTALHFSIFLQGSTEMLCYVIYDVYSTLCCVLAAITATRLLREQQNIKD